MKQPQSQEFKQHDYFTINRDELNKSEMRPNTSLKDMKSNNLQNNNAEYHIASAPNKNQVDSCNDLFIEFNLQT